MALPLSVSVSIFVLIVAYILYRRLRFKLPPGPRPWPIVGNLYDINPIMFRCFAEWAQAYGPIVSVWFGSALNVVVCNAELAKQVLKENDQQLADRHRTRLTARFSRDGKDLIWADYGPHYVKLRKVSTLELFSAKRLDELRPIREDEVTFMVESIFKDCTNPENHGKSLSVKKYLGDVAFNNITRLAFGKRFMNSEGIIDEQGQELKAIVNDGSRLGASPTMAEHIPWLQWMFPLEEEAFAKLDARRDRLVRSIMEEHNNARKRSGGAKNHFVDALLTLQEKYDLSEVSFISLLWHLPYRHLFFHNMALPLSVSVSIFVLIVAYILHRRLRFKLPPGPRPWPVVGNLYDINPIMFRCFAEWAQAYGPIVSVWFGSALNVVVCNAELAKQVLKENDQQLADRHRTRLTARFSRDGKDLIWADYGPHYVKLRKVSTLELFSAKRLDELRPIREDEVTFMVESIFKDCTNPENHGKSLSVKKYLGDVAFNNITRLAFGKRFMNSEGIIDEQGQELKAIVNDGSRLGASPTMAEHIPWLQWMFPLEEEVLAKLDARRDRLVRSIMEEHNNARKKSGGAKNQFVDALLTLQEKYDLSEVSFISLLWWLLHACLHTCTNGWLQICDLHFAAMVVLGIVLVFELEMG
ncbi:hypothetical protein DKX38_023590 [Salix brachista]|uniref:Cytochrome P450 n=1 Tax=Salix brachista TaxID=2182728 RepID=A0A5N5JJ90_9ROSI|nr:hypothetical protein DKX38_023590 [Salix brachista]